MSEWNQTGRKWSGGDILVILAIAALVLAVMMVLSKYIPVCTSECLPYPEEVEYWPEEYPCKSPSQERYLRELKQL